MRKCGNRVMYKVYLFIYQSDRVSLILNAWENGI